jgi:hypothetical protein
MKQNHFIHLKNGNLYTVVEEDIKVQVDGVWVDAIRYHRQFEPFQSFVRPRREFFEVFRPASLDK